MACREVPMWEILNVLERLAPRTEERHRPRYGPQAERGAPLRAHRTRAGVWGK